MEKIIAPSMLSIDFLKLEEELKELNDTNAKWLHLDVMDGIFVPNISFGFDIIKQAKQISNLYFDVHLMIANPIKYIEASVNSGADSITFHSEIEGNVLDTIKEIRKFNKNVGLAINPNTEVEKIIPYLDEVDLVLVMSVNPGFGGQSYIVEVEEKIKELQELRKSKLFKYQIQIDGGINDETVKGAFKSGVDIAVAGSYIFNGNKKNQIDLLLGNK